MSILGPWTPLDRLDSRERVCATLVAETGLRIGAGRELELAVSDLPVLVDARGLPYLPGSSLKGVLRAGLAAAISGLGDPRLTACDSVRAPCLCELKRCTIDDPAERQRLRDEALARALEHSCVVCGLFGSVHLAGRVFVHDARLADAPTERPRRTREVREGVAILRDLRTVAGTRKYDLEVVPAGTRFELELTLENVDEIRRALVLDALWRLDQGSLRLGGGARRGLGRVRILDLRGERWTLEALRTGDSPAAFHPDTARRDGLARLTSMLDSTRETA
ncbi:MAG: CRISPR-associated RAMP protein Csx7 [Acidobacteriota bacterium]